MNLADYQFHRPHRWITVDQTHKNAHDEFSFSVTTTIPDCASVLCHITGCSQPLSSNGLSCVASTDALLSPLKTDSNGPEYTPRLVKAPNTLGVYPPALSIALQISTSSSTRTSSLHSTQWQRRIPFS